MVGMTQRCRTCIPLIPTHALTGSPHLARSAQTNTPALTARGLELQERHGLGAAPVDAPQVLCSQYTAAAGMGIAQVLRKTRAAVSGMTPSVQSRKKPIARQEWARGASGRCFNKKIRAVVGCLGGGTGSILMPIRA
jgi:hypothetical protein